jgi:hypothetical protein
VVSRNFGIGPTAGANHRADASRARGRRHVVDFDERVIAAWFFVSVVFATPIVTVAGIVSLWLLFVA